MSLQLYPFQQYTIDRLKDVRSSLIGDDMGLGKTIQGIALDLKRRELYGDASSKTLVVTPLGVVSSWKRQFEKWSDLKVITINNRNRVPFEEAIEFGTHDVYIMHWDALRLMPILAQQKWFHVIGDEIHKIQNRKTKVTFALKEIDSIFKTGLSGTPAYDKPDDLWSVLNWLYPTYWSSYWGYFDKHVLWVDYNGYKQVIGVANQLELQEKMRGFYIRRKMEEVHDLPDIIVDERFVDLTPKQRRAYNQMRDSMLAWVGDNEDQPVNASVVVAQLTRLQQLAAAHADIVKVQKTRRVDPKAQGVMEKLDAQGWTVDEKNYIIDKLSGERVLFDESHVVLADPSSKIDAALEILDSTDRPVVFFSQFSQVIDLFCKRLEAHGISYGKYTGDTGAKDRERIVDEFKRGKLRVFAGTLGAGGTGLDGLQEASNTIVFFDRAWSHSVNNQAIGRLYRIGQTLPVHVIDLIATGTIERKRRDKIELEWQWIRELLGEED